MRQAPAVYLVLDVRPQGCQACLVHAEVAQADPQDALRAKQVSRLENNGRACACALLIVTPASSPRRGALCVCENQVPRAGNAACARRRRSHGSPRTGTACTPRPRRGKAWRWPARARLRLQDGYAAGGRAAHAHQHVVRKAPGAGHSARVQEAPALPALVPTRHSCSHKPDASQRPCGLPP